MSPTMKPVNCPSCNERVIEIGFATEVTCLCNCGELLAVSWMPPEAKRDEEVSSVEASEQRTAKEL